MYSRVNWRDRREEEGGRRKEEGEEEEEEEEEEEKEKEEKEEEEEETEEEGPRDHPFDPQKLPILVAAKKGYSLGITHSIPRNYPFWRPPKHG